jgi:hypothetical protein
MASERLYLFEYRPADLFVFSEEVKKWPVFCFRLLFSAPRIVRPVVVTLLGFIVLSFTAFPGVGRLYEFPVKEKAIKG